jgi:N,N-dimethylformamidase
MASDERYEADGAEDTHLDAAPQDASTTVTRRGFLKTIGVGSLASTMMGADFADVEAAVAQQRAAAAAGTINVPRYVPIPQDVAANLVKKGIVGYADRLGVQPGETIKFMVSSEAARYRADIVRLIHGDPNPKGPGIKEIVVDSPTNAEYAGKRQVLPFGSYVTVPDHASLRLAGSFTFTAWIAPTTLRPGTGQPEAAARVDKVEGILTKWTDSEQSGFGVFIDAQGRLTLKLSEGGGQVQVLSADVPLRPWVPAIPGMNNRPQGVATAWYFVAISFDAARGSVLLFQNPLNVFSFDPSRIAVDRPTTIKRIAPNRAPLLMAAYWAAPGEVAGHYNGKLDNPRLYARALSRAEIEAIGAGRGPGGALANWDFSADIESDRVTDTAPGRRHGQTVNMPMRGVTGHNWDASEMDYKRARTQYGAIYFHDDDLEDAKWDVGFEYRVPADLKSGLYAARLRTENSEDYVPFCVRPRQGAATARIALLIPTFSYLAYAGTGTTAFSPLSLYSRHSDGSGVCYSSRLRPITNMRPKINTNNPWQFMADTHLVDWLDVKGFSVDVLTDEDLHREGAALLKPYKVAVTGTHPEYYSREMLQGLRTYLEGGGRLMYMGGNGFYWVTPMDPAGRYIEVRRRDGTEHWQGAPGEHYHSLTGEPGGLWRFRGMAPQQFFGVGFTAQGFDRNSPFRRMPGSYDPRVAFIFEGIGRDELIGDFPSLVLQHGAAGSELDRVDYTIGSPPHTLILASSFGHSDAYQHVVEQINTSNNARPGGTQNPLVRADMAYLEYPNGGAVFSTSSIAWCGSLSYNHYDNNVSRITANVLTRFASDEPLPSPIRTTQQTAELGSAE